MAAIHDGPEMDWALN